MPTVDFKKQLIRKLKNREYAAGYLTAALEEGEEVFLLALRDVAQAHGSITALARATKLNRENLYVMLSESGNPRLSSIAAILDRLGVLITFQSRNKTSKAA